MEKYTKERNNFEERLRAFASSKEDYDFITNDLNQAGDLEDYSYYLGLLDTIDFFNLILENASNTDLSKKDYLEGVFEKLEELMVE